MNFNGGFGMPMNGFNGGGFGQPGGQGGSYHGSPGGGGYGGRGRGRRDDRGSGRGRGRGGFGSGGHGGNSRGGQPPAESSSARMRKMVVRFADEEDFHPLEDPPRLAKVLRRSWREASHGVCDGFRIGITQEPHKHSHYITLLLALSHRPAKADITVDEDPEEANAGEKRKLLDEDPECEKDVLEDLSRGFRGWVEGREWLNMRLCLQFFSLCVPAGLITARSLLDVYKSLLGVLSEVGGGGDRAERVVRAVAEGLMRSGKIMYEQFQDEVDEIVNSIEQSIQGRKGARDLLVPFAPIKKHGEESETYHDSLDLLLQALLTLRAEGFTIPDLMPRHYEDFLAPEGSERIIPVELATISMPPELYDVDENKWQVGEGQIGCIDFFVDTVVPRANTAFGWTLRSLILDLVHIFEVNRKESARILLSLNRYTLPGTFKPPAPPAGGAPVPEPSETISTSTISLESCIISTLLNVLFLLPWSPCKLIYYGSVITELCKISPNTVAPPVGRAVRKLYSLMGSEGLDAEIARRAAEWFAIHLSNFGFQWMWKEWIPDLELPAAHPKRAFIRRIVELEIRLAYHDRILETLPEAMTAESAGVISAVPADPVWPYANADHPLHSEATALHQMFRTKETSLAIRDHLKSLREASSGPDDPLPDEIRLMAVETLLHLGSRSFSHFLNATERYLDILRFLSPDPSSRRIILDGIRNFWITSSQMRLVTADKYIQYGILEGQDVVDWIFAEDDITSRIGVGEQGDSWTDGDSWEMLRMCLDKHVGRVAALRRRVKQVEKDDETARARRAAERLERGEGVGEEDVEQEDVRQDRSKEARDAQTSLDIQVTKMEKVLLTTTKHFVATLLPWCFDPLSTSQGLRSVLDLLDSDEEGNWTIRARWSWYREFVRLYARYLTPLRTVVEDDVLVCLPQRDVGKEGEVEVRAENMVRSIWVQAMGDE